MRTASRYMSYANNHELLESYEDKVEAWTLSEAKCHYLDKSYPGRGKSAIRGRFTPIGETCRDARS